MIIIPYLQALKIDDTPYTLHGICARANSAVRPPGTLKAAGQDFVLTLDRGDTRRPKPGPGQHQNGMHQLNAQDHLTGPLHISAAASVRAVSSWWDQQSGQVVADRG
jgi:hypothetical protein